MTSSKSTLRIKSATPSQTLEVWQFLPTVGEKPFPTIILGHGFSLRKNDGLEPFALRFAEAGFACLVLDYRHFGASDGQPRQVISPEKQREDYKSVIKYARNHRETFDASRLGIWGTSFSGGHVWQLSSEDPSLAFAISQCPFVGQGSSSSINLHILKLVAWSIASSTRQLLGFAPLYIPVAPAQPVREGQKPPWAFFNSNEGYEAFKMFGAPVEDPLLNRVDANIVLKIPSYRPAANAERIKCPFLLCVGETDEVVSIETARAAVKKVEKGEVFQYKGSHFSPYKGGQAHNETVAAQIEFLKRHTT